MNEITLDTIVQEITVPLDQVLALSAEDRFPEARDKGLWSVAGDKLVLVWDGDEVISLTTADTLRSSKLPRTLSRPLGDYLSGQPAPQPVWADESLVVLATQARFVLGGDYCLVWERATDRLVGVLVSSQVGDLVSRLRVPGWEEGWQDGFALSAVLHVSGEATIAELVAQVGGLLIGEEAQVASYYEENDQWIVYALKEFAHPGKAVKAATNIHQILKNTIEVSKNEWRQVAVIET